MRTAKKNNAQLYQHNGLTPSAEAGFISASVCTDSPQTPPTNYFDGTKFETSIVPAGSQAKNHSCGKLSVLVLNCQSVVSKKADLNCFIEATNPNIIIASETWLKPTIISSEFLPQHYIAYRKDREDGYGGVLLAHKYKITLT